MTRLLVEVEGQTEETFVNDLLAPHLYARGYTLVAARLLGNARQRDHRGGIRPWPSALRDIAMHLKEDRGRLVTTMVDYYALPATGAHAWPGRAAAATLPFAVRADTVESALRVAVAAELGDETAAERFIPYVMMHEFEAMLFSDCAAFARGIHQPALAKDFQRIRDQFATPEEINDSPETAPSKRVAALIPGYEKPLLGNLAVLEIGLEAVRRACPHFHAWLAELERRAPAPAPAPDAP